MRELDCETTPMSRPNFNDAQKLADAKALAASFKSGGPGKKSGKEKRNDGGSYGRSFYQQESYQPVHYRQRAPPPAQSTAMGGPPPPSQRNYMAFGKFGDQTQKENHHRGSVIGKQGLDFLLRADDSKKPTETKRDDGASSNGVTAPAASHPQPASTDVAFNSTKPKPSASSSNAVLELFNSLMAEKRRQYEQQSQADKKPSQADQQLSREKTQSMREEPQPAPADIQLVQEEKLLPQVAEESTSAPMSLDGSESLTTSVFTVAQVATSSEFTPKSTTDNPTNSSPERPLTQSMARAPSKQMDHNGGLARSRWAQ